MLSNQADSGGALLIENDCDVTINDSTFNGNSAIAEGGIMSIINTQTGTLPTSTVTVENCNTFSGANAEKGGIFYVNHAAVNVIVNNVQISSPTAGQSGGVAYIESANQFNISNSYFHDFYAPETTCLYSSSPNLEINIISTEITCNTSYDRT